MYIPISDYDVATERLKRSLEIHEQIGKRYGEATAYANLGWNCVLLSR